MWRRKVKVLESLTPVYTTTPLDLPAARELFLAARADQARAVGEGRGISQILNPESDDGGDIL